MGLFYKGAGVLPYVITDDLKIKVLLGKRAIDPDKGKWSLFGGKRNPDEASVKTAARELREETGIIAAESELKHICNICLIVFDYDVFSLDMKSVDAKVRLNWENSECRWFDIDEAISLGNQLARCMEMELKKLKECLS